LDRPGIIDPPGIDDRPGFADRPGRPGRRPAIINRPINIDDIHIGNNNVISHRPSWSRIDRDRVTRINNRWQNNIGDLGNWRDRHPNRAGYWSGWADGVRHHWDHHHHDWFGPAWWGHHHHHWGGWHYGHGFNRHPWSYWWTVPTFAACTNWFTWSAPATVWSQPVYYDYGTGGNVVYQDNSVYINGQGVATADEFAQSAMDLATVPPPASEEQAAEVEWLPLGTFAVSAGERDVAPTRVIQLAVSQDGIISGTLYNSTTDQADTVQGQVDKETQRVAFRVGESEDVVVESGLYNLTQKEAPALVHFGPDRVENWLLVRLENPDAGEG
jgi:hypothetical protein